ncbi:MAG: hypothetical protein CMJ94_08325 [Planctomycetes bacterium]|nr:hypothetical protein [Planctomycetota bacterium]
MLDLLITLIAVAPVIMALLAAVAPPKAAWIRPALLPAVLLQLALAVALSYRQFFFGYLFAGEPPRALSSEEVQAFTNATAGLGLPITLALAAAITALASAVAFARARRLRLALPWLTLAAACLCADRLQSAAVRAVAAQPEGSSVDLDALLATVQDAIDPWVLPGTVLFLLSFPFFSWTAWWSRARWTHGFSPAGLCLLVGLPCVLVAQSFSLGAAWATQFEQSTGALPDAGLPIQSGLPMASAMLLFAAALSALQAFATWHVSRMQCVSAGRAVLRGAAWLPIAWAAFAASALLTSEQEAISSLLVPASQAGAVSPFTLVEDAMQTWLPQLVYAAVIGLVMITAAGPLRSDRRSVRPSAEA